MRKKFITTNVLQGDVQTCVSVLLVLGEKSKEFIDLGTQKLWFLDYIGNRCILDINFSVIILHISFIRVLLFKTIIS